MHELALTKDILGVAERHAKKSGASRVNAIFLRIGILRDIEPAWMQRYFRYISKGTMAEEAEILIMVEPVVCKCNICGGQFGVELEGTFGKEILCPHCQTHDYEMIAGTEFIIQGIEVA